MISAGDFRNGMTFEMDGQVVQIAPMIFSEYLYRNYYHRADEDSQ